MATERLANMMTLKEAHARHTAMEMKTNRARTTSAAESRSTSSQRQRTDI